MRFHLEDGRSVVLRIDRGEDAGSRPPELPPEPELEPLASLLRSRGLPVPEVLAEDRSAGLDLLEDRGRVDLASLAQKSTPAERRSLYRLALGWIPVLQATEPQADVPAFSRRMDARYFAYKASLFADWSLPQALRREARPSERERVAEAFAHCAEVAQAAPQRLSHRDLQSRNVLARRDAEGDWELGMIDFQGALLAAPEYDLVCLLRDSYVELPDDELDAHLESLREALPDLPEEDAFRRRFDLLTLTRKGKDHARFLYAAQRAGHRESLAHLPTTVRALRAASTRRAAEHPALADLCAWIAELPEGTACAE